MNIIPTFSNIIAQRWNTQFLNKLLDTIPDLFEKKHKHQKHRFHKLKHLFPV